MCQHRICIGWYKLAFMFKQNAPRNELIDRQLFDFLTLEI